MQDGRDSHYFQGEKWKTEEKKTKTKQLRIHPRQYKRSSKWLRLGGWPIVRGYISGSTACKLQTYCLVSYLNCKSELFSNSQSLPQGRTSVPKPRTCLGFWDSLLTETRQRKRVRLILPRQLSVSWLRPLTAEVVTGETSKENNLLLQIRKWLP